MSHKSSASSLNTPVVGSNRVGSVTSITSSNNNFETHQLPSVPANSVPNKPPRFSVSSSAISLSKVDNIKEDEWGLKLYGKQVNNNVKR